MAGCSRSVGEGGAVARNTRGLTGSVIVLIVPLLQAPSRPSKDDADLEALRSHRRLSERGSAARVDTATRSRV
jgi:hypothetical protein